MRYPLAFEDQGSVLQIKAMCLSIKLTRADMMTNSLENPRSENTTEGAVGKSN